MTNLDPNLAPNTTVIRRTIVRGSNTTGWIIAGLVAVLAIVGIAYMATAPSNSQATSDQITAAQQQGRAQGAADASAQAAAQSSQAAAQTQQAAAAQAAQSNAQAQAAADRAAASAADARNAPPAPATSQPSGDASTPPPPDQ